MNLSRTIITFVSLLAVTFGQTPEEKEKRKPKWQPNPIERPEELTSDSDAKQQVADFGKAYGKAETILDKKYAIDGLAKCRNKRAAQALEKVLLREKEPALRAQAALALAIMAIPESEPALIKALKARINKDEDDVLENIGTALGQLSDKSLYSKIYREFDEFGKGGKSALILIFGYRKDEEALRLLSEWLDEPRPENPDSPSNPPAEYWKQKFAEYYYVRDEVVWAMWQITGEIFTTEEDYRKWQTKRKEEERSNRSGMRRRD